MSWKMLLFIAFIRLERTLADNNKPFAAMDYSADTSTPIFPTFPPFSTTPSIAYEELVQLSNTLVQLYQENATLRPFMSNVTGICPGWVPCNILRPADPGRNCCLSCFCDSNCNKIRPCCLGFQPNGTERGVPVDYADIQKICVDSAYFTNRSSITSKTANFEMIADCPVGTSAEVMDKCTALFTNVENDFYHSFFDVIPISDSQTQTNFANRHCAACYGLPGERYLQWSMEVSYKNMFCAICNGENYTRNDAGLCPDVGFENVYLGYRVFLNFDAEFQEANSEIQDPNVNKCPLGFMVDPLSGLCKEVVCSFPRVLNKLSMVCVDRFESMSYGSVEIPYRFDIDPSQTINIRGLSQFHENLNYTLDPFRNGISCNFHSIFYKTDVPFDSLQDQSFLSDDVKVTSGILIVYADLSRPYFRSFQSVLKQYREINLTVDNRLIDFEYGDIDTAYLPTARNITFPDTVNKLIGDLGLPRKRSGEIGSVYRDPFDGNTVLRFGVTFNVLPCVSTNLLYKKNYYECSAFEYDMNVNEINYTSAGIVLTSKGIHLNFGEFRTLNESHVAICLDKLEEKGLSVKSFLSVSGSVRKKGLFINPSLLLLTLLLMKDI